jgi:uncharacterized protein (DUF1800 family)
MSCATGTIAPYLPSTNVPWNRMRVAHLYRRMGFSATNAQIINGLTLSPNDLIDQLVAEAVALPLSTPPTWYDWTREPINDYSDYGGEIYAHRQEWTRVWINNMITNGLRDKLTLFWHNHFVTQWDSYNCSAFLYEYHKLLEQYALGNFKLFVHKMGITPAMLMFLNGNLSTLDHPNENYARELMELFTMGQNNGYTEQDIIEMARALTGWVCTSENCQPSSFDPTRFDNTDKTIFGQTGNWGNTESNITPTNVVNLIFTYRQDQVATHICTKLCKFFVNNSPDTDIVNALATTFKANNFELVPVLKQLFKSEYFFDDANIGILIKSPLELLNGIVQQWQISYNNDTLDAIMYWVSELGQQIWIPVNVAGWPGHRTWINENRLTKRWQFSSYILYGANEATTDNWVTLAKDLSNNSTDPYVVTQSIVDFILPKGLLNQSEYNAATNVFKASIPENYFEQNYWNLDWDNVKWQIMLLLQHLIKQPAFQLN